MAVDPAEDCVGADVREITCRGPVRRPRSQLAPQFAHECEIDSHTIVSVDVRNPRVAVAGDGVVAIKPLEFV